MHDPHKQPLFLYTTYLQIDTIALSQEHTSVWLYGIYGNLLSGEIHDIKIEVDFALFNGLLYLADEEQVGQPSKPP
jgi:hypothetical protein